MNKKLNLVFLAFFICVLLTCNEKNVEVEQAQGNDFSYNPVNFTQVAIKDGFWKSRVETTCRVTIPFAFQKSEETNRINNFKYAAGVEEGRFGSPCGYDDSDVYKVVEGASYALMLEDNPKLKSYLDTIISYIAGAQEEDGYLYTAWTLKANDYAEVWCSYSEEGQFEGSVISHELYNVGHMYEAATAHYLATNESTLLDVATKNADLIYDICITQGKDYYPGHQEIEIGLTKLYRVTKNKNYLELAKHFLDQRGKGLREYLSEEEAEVPWETAPYSQDHVPVIDQKEAVGHSVRANYMYAAMADIAALSGDEDYLDAIDAIWYNVVGRKLYVTGGVGAGSHGESYGVDYDLPNRSYAETCAAIANVYWNHRMFLLHGSSKYIDVLERTLYNGLLAGLSLEGDRFFYSNPLVLKDGELIKGAPGRKQWFNTSCCPSNLSRFVPSIGGYVYATKGAEVFINLYMSNQAEIETTKGTIELEQVTNYPWEGKIKLLVQNEEEVATTLKLRIPGWAIDQPVPSDLYSYQTSSAEKPKLMLNGKEVNLDIKDGYAKLEGNWKKGDIIDLELPMSVHKIKSNPLVKENKEKLALEYGPIVFCAEGIDNKGYGQEIVIKENTPFKAEYKEDLLKGINVLKGEGQVEKEPISLQLIPYYAWSHRGPGAMSVWFEKGD